MLQINSGKLYPNGVRRTNELRGVLYSNLFLMQMEDRAIVTQAGRLLQAEASNLTCRISRQLFPSSCV